MDGSGSKSHTGILNRAAQGNMGWVSNQGVGLGGFGASVELGDPPAAQAPSLAWVLASESRKGVALFTCRVFPQPTKRR